MDRRSGRGGGGHRAGLITTVPALRAIALRWLFDAQHEWSAALAEAHPEDLDDLTAHALVGAMISAGMASLGTGADITDVALRTAEVALAASGQR